MRCVKSHNISAGALSLEGFFYAHDSVPSLVSINTMIMESANTCQIKNFP